MENLNAAIPAIDNLSNLSPQEFQNMLTSWFEEKGIVSDLRSHLRFKMINVLKNTAIGRDINKKTPHHNTLSKQAINLIVAEFLMKNNCHYSLSIFNTEAALTNIFPEYPLFDNSKEPFQYDSETILNILELIGVSKGSEFAKAVLNLYFQSQENCILSCLVILLCKLTVGKSKEKDEDITQIDLSKESNFLKQVGNILLKNKVSSENIMDMLRNIDFFHNVELTNIEERYSHLISELRNETRSQESKMKELTKMKKLVENNLIKVVGDYNALKVQMKKLVKESQELHINKNGRTIAIGEHSVSEPLLHKEPIICHRKHCEEKCLENINLLYKLQIENQELQRRSREQVEEYAIISSKYNDLLQDFKDYQNKISLLNSRINESSTNPVVEAKPKILEASANVHNNRTNIPLQTSLTNTYDISESSDSVTEEVIREARLRLKLLEEESKKIEENYKSIQKDLCHMKL
nr:uncharacterized protein LOC111509590 [Leptinotarsa decemlineata]